MKRLRSLVLTAATIILCSSYSFSQQLSSKVLLTIDDTPITVDEFKSIYLKNNTSSSSVDRVAMEDYLKLFVNFKLKVQESRNQKIDTSAAFVTEYKGYINQLAQPYLTDAASDVQLLDEAYERMKYEVSASHILINIPESASPADTLKLYRKALEARSRVIKGESFGSVAISTSNDPSVSRNSGFLGYFSAFQMVYPFETAAYNTPKDSVSLPVRTRFGYHIIKVHDKRPARGQVKVAHIMIRVQPNSNPQDAENARQKIVDIHNRIKSGADFATVAREESQDPGTAKNGGELPWLSSGQIIPEFERVAFGLTADGEVSEPFQSTYGWHVVKRLGRKMLGTKEEMLPEIKSLVAKDSRNIKSRESFLKKIKVEYGFKEDTAKLSLVQSIIDSSFYKGTWKAPVLKNNAFLFSFSGGTYNISDFTKFIEGNQRFVGQYSISNFVRLAYNEFVNSTLITYEESKLGEKHPEFRQLSKEYLEGMMLFEITNNVVWKKSTDSLGIVKFFEANKGNYTWGERIHYAVYTTNDAKVKDKIVAGLAKRKSKNISPSNYISKFNIKSQVVSVEEKSANNDNPEIASFKTWKNDNNVSVLDNGQFVVTEILKVTNGDPKSLDDCKGQVVADYQQKLEEEWMVSLKNKYTVSVDENVFNELVSQFSKK